MKNTPYKIRNNEIYGDLTAWLTAGWEMQSASAAAVMPPHSHTLQNTR